MQFDIFRLTENQISNEYLSTLNDSTYMQFSQHMKTKATKFTQRDYLSSFDFTTNFLLAITDRHTGEQVATASLRLLPGGKVVNIGFLVFRNFGGKGLGKKIFRELSAWVFNLFPLTAQQIGTRQENFGMQRIALSAEFLVDKTRSDREYVYFIKEATIAPELLEFIDADIHIVCNDAGGALNISALANALIQNATVTLAGPAVDIFANNCPAITNLDISSQLLAEKNFLLGSGFYGGLESRVLENIHFRSNKKAVLIDHWVNYKERFDPNLENLPDAIFVTNLRAEVIANKNFPQTKVVRIPDFLLADQRRNFLTREVVQNSILVILEPNPLKGSGLDYQIKGLESYLPTIFDFCRKHELTEVILRPHPAQALDKNLNWVGIATGIQVRFSESDSLVEDLLNAKAVFGFHSSALYASAMLGVETYSFFAKNSGHWTGLFPEILGID